MLVIGALDSSLLSLPEINDYLVVTRCYLHPQALIYFPLFAATGSVIGSLLLYTLLRRGVRQFCIDVFQSSIFNGSRGLTRGLDFSRWRCRPSGHRPCLSRFL